MVQSTDTTDSVEPQSALQGSEWFYQRQLRRRQNLRSQVRRPRPPLVPVAMLESNEQPLQRWIDNLDWRGQEFEFEIPFNEIQHALEWLREHVDLAEHPRTQPGFRAD